MLMPVLLALSLLAPLPQASLATSSDNGPLAAPGVSKLAWDYSDEDLKAGAVSRFEVAYDGGAWADAGLVATIPGVYVADFAALQPGEHAVAVRACSAVACSPATPSLTFRLVVIPVTPSNLRIISGQ